MIAFGLIGFSALLSLGFDGATALEPRFVGSTGADIRDYPYQLSIYYGKNNVCGAAIIAPRWAITAANCLDFKIPTMVNLRAGSNETQTGGTVYKVSNFYIHPRYNKTTYEYNVALLNLTRPFVFSKSVGPIPLISANRIVPIGTNAVVTGWGFLSNSRPIFSPTLRKLTIPVLNPFDCRSYYPRNFDPNTMICTKNVNNVKCLYSSSGYPLAVNGTLVGILSGGAWCTNAPGIFTKLSASNIRSWISAIARV